MGNIDIMGLSHYEPEGYLPLLIQGCAHTTLLHKTVYIHSSIGLSFQYYFLLNRLTYGAKVSKVSRNKIRIFRYVVEKVCIRTLVYV